jgi:cytochrome c oxidase subunit 2
MPNIQWLPEQASSLAGRVDMLFLFLLGISLLMAVLLTVLVVAFAVKYRRGARAGEMPRGREGSMELLWVGGLLVLFLGLFAWAARLYVIETGPPAAGLEIHAVGKQWMWQFQHPTGQREINQLHVPADTDVKVILATQDVIHSFYVPAFRLKQDAVPGRYTTTWFRPTRTGRFHLFCAEYCGLDHARMGGWVVVMESAQYERWLSERSVPIPLATGGTVQTVTPLAAQGEQLFGKFGCGACHGAGAQGLAPSLAGIFGEAAPLQGGRTVTVDENYLRDSILTPSKQIVAGFAPIMPSFAGQMSEDDLLKLIAYIKALSPKEKAP